MTVTRSDLSDLVRFHTDRVLSQLGNPHRKDARIDAGETFMTARNLEHVLAKVFEVQYPDAKWRNLFPINTEVPSGAETFSEDTIDMTGEALFGDPDEDNFPLVDVKLTNTAGKLRSIMTGYRYSIQDLRASAMSGRPLDAKRAIAARRKAERVADRVMFLGDTATGFSGFAATSGVGTAVTITDKGADDTWTSTTVTGGVTALGQAIADDVHKMANQIFTDTKGIRGQRLTLVVGTKGYATLAAPRTFGSVPMTLAEFLLTKHPWLEAIEFSPQLDAAGAGSKERVIVYQRDPEVLEAIVSQDFEQFAPQARNLHFVVPCHMRIGGLLVHEPKAIAYMDGTQP